MTREPRPGLRLLPCPFCGSAGTFRRSDTIPDKRMHGVACSHTYCPAKPATWADSRTAAARLWNRRAPGAGA